MVLAEDLIRLLGERPFCLGLGDLSSRLASLGLDGAMTEGGPEADHASSRVGNIVLEMLERLNDLAFLDLLHAFSTGCKHAFSRNQRLQTFLSLQQELANSLGSGQGLQLAGTVRDFLRDSPAASSASAKCSGLRTKNPQVTRMAAASLVRLLFTFLVCAPEWGTTFQRTTVLGSLQRAIATRKCDPPESAQLAC